MNETDITLPATIWHMDPNEPTAALLEGEDGRVTVERPDADEVAVHFVLPDDSQAVSSIYLTRAQAVALAGLLQMEAGRAL